MKKYLLVAALLSMPAIVEGTAKLMKTTINERIKEIDENKRLPEDAVIKSLMGAKFTPEQIEAMGELIDLVTQRMIDENNTRLDLSDVKTTKEPSRALEEAKKSIKKEEKNTKTTSRRK